jgi:glycosyltransferase involved in cell wall biosynthesis
VEHSVKPSAPGAIGISVVVPVLNEEESIRILLDGLLSQTLPPNEIVVTDGGSIDATREIIEEFIGRGAPVKLVRERDSLPGRARNVGVKNASCDWIAFTDAGTRPAPDWLAELAGKAGDDGAAAVVFGSYEPVVDSFFRECAAIAYVPATTLTPNGPVRPLSIVSALMRRTVWEHAGGFPEHLRSAEDLVFMNRIEAEGYRITRAPRAVVYWTIQPGLWKTFRRFVTYSRNNIRAGLWRKWQAAIFQRYALMGIIAVPAVFLGVEWLAVPILLVLAQLVIRAIRAGHQNRHSYPAGITRSILRLLPVVVIIATLDAAAFVGSISWLLFDKLHLATTK